MALMAALRRPGLAYFLVGDDWQSIYRFAGSDVSLVRRCGEYLGHVRERTLTTTFRYREGILEPTAAFVQRNPHQTQRSLRTGSTADDEGITIVACETQRQGVATALDDMSAKAPGGKSGGTGGADDGISVLCIGRYRHSRESIPGRRRHHWPDYEFSTAHGAKGREADYTVVLDLTDDRMGFPAQLEDDPLLDLVLPPTSDSGVSWAEERRLFYVATTRARRGAYLVSDRVQPSEFVREMRATYERYAPGWYIRRGRGARMYSLQRVLGQLADGEDHALHKLAVVSTPRAPVRQLQAGLCDTSSSKCRQRYLHPLSRSPGPVSGVRVWCPCQKDGSAWSVYWLHGVQHRNRHASIRNKWLRLGTLLVRPDRRSNVAGAADQLRGGLISAAPVHSGGGAAGNGRPSGRMNCTPSALSSTVCLWGDGLNRAPAFPRERTACHRRARIRTPRTESGNHCCNRERQPK